MPLELEYWRLSASLGAGTSTQVLSPLRCLSVLTFTFFTHRISLRLIRRKLSDPGSLTRWPGVTRASSTTDSDHSAHFREVLLTAQQCHVCVG